MVSTARRCSESGGGEIQIGAGLEIIDTAGPRSLDCAVNPAQQIHTPDLRLSYRSLCRLHRDPLQSGADAEHGRGVKMLSVDLGGDFAVECFERYIAGLKRSIRQFISPPKLAEINVTLRRRRRQSVAREAAVN